MKPSVWLTSFLLVLMPGIAEAGLLFGHVSGGGFRPERDSFRISTSEGNVAVDVVKTNDHNDYRVLLATGIYVASYVDKSGTMWTATLISDTEPRCQDIVFKRVSK
jgi:hypothetical protein